MWEAVYKDWSIGVIVESNGDAVMRTGIVLQLFF